MTAEATPDETPHTEPGPSQVPSGDDVAETAFTPLVPETDMAPGASPELVSAFRMNAEALHRLQDMQEQLVSAVQRSNRSEMVLQSTQSLNETFRNLTQVQRTLLDRIEGGATQRTTGRLVPLMLIGLLIVIVGGVAVIVESVRRGGDAPPVDQAQLAAQVRATYQKGREEGAAQRDAELERLHVALNAADERIMQHQEALDAHAREREDLERAHHALEMTNKELGKEAMAGRQATQVVRTLEQELDRVNREKAASDEVIAKHRAAEDKARRQNLELRKRIAAHGLGLPDDPDYDPLHDPNAPADPPFVSKTRPLVHFPDQDATPATPEPQPQWGAAGAVPPPPSVRRASGSASGDTPPPARRTADLGAPPAPLVRRGMRGSGEVTELPRGIPPLPTSPALVRQDDRLDRSPRATKQVRNVLNGLLERSRDRSGALYQVTKLGGVSPDRLAGVRLIRYDDTQKVPEIITANETRVIVDRARQEVVLVVRGGHRVGKSRRELIPPQGARITVARGPDVQAWLDSGLKIMQTR